MEQWPPSTPPAQPTGTKGATDWVDTAVFGPKRVPQGQHFLLQAFAHLPKMADEAEQLAKGFDDDATRLGFKTLGAMLMPGARLTFSLSVPGVDLVGSSQDLVWQRRTASVAFGIEVPAERHLGPLIGTVTVSVDAVPIGRITFKVTVTAARAGAKKLDALDAVVTDIRRFSLAFISYASEDRDIVLQMAQMLWIQRIEFFADVLDLKPSDRWAQELFRYIEQCDLFLLFWSSNAKASKWVIQEALHALRLKAGDDDAPPTIHPVIIEGPPPVDPPPELAHIHFGDPVRYFRGHKRGA